MTRLLQLESVIRDGDRGATMPHVPSPGSICDHPVLQQLCGQYEPYFPRTPTRCEPASGQL